MAWAMIGAEVTYGDDGSAHRRAGRGEDDADPGVLPRLPGPAGGFYTEEIRERGQRVGFRLVTLAGETVTLAHTPSPAVRSLPKRSEGLPLPGGGRHRVGRYAVDVAALDRVGVAAIRRAVAAGHVVVIDEIGKMELFSAAFRAAVLEAVASDSPVLGTVMLQPHPWADALKARPGVHVLTVTRENRDALVEDVLARLVGSSLLPNVIQLPEKVLLAPCSSQEECHQYNDGDNYEE